MNKYWILFIGLQLLCTLVLKAQQQISTQEEIEIYTSNFENSVKLVNNFVGTKKLNLNNQDLSVSDFTIDFYINKKGFAAFQDLIPQLGYIHKKNINTGASNKTENLNLKLKYLKKQKNIYEAEIAKLQVGSERYNTLWAKIRDFERQIYDTKSTSLRQFKPEKYRVILSLIDETNDFTSDKISWVNMPGAQFVYFVPENPIANISAKQYIGYSLKYLFTKGKSYAGLSSLKEFSAEPASQSRIAELFILNFGQDFYSKYFGRGKNKFLNLYTGYNLGFIFQTGSNFQSYNFSVSPSVGLEIFKNKYILLDTKAEYFVPFKENKNLRGLMLKASFNFVF